MPPCLCGEIIEIVISVVQLGILDYATGLRLQQRLVEMRKASRIGDVLLLLEHTPVITLGRNAKHANVLASPQRLQERGVEIFECDRGGDVTFHGPGQLVGYPIFGLHGFAADGGSRKTLGAIEYVRRLEEVLIRTCEDFGIPARRIAGLTGVWTAPEDPASAGQKSAQGNRRPEAKIAAIGVHISRGVTSHGFALNVDTDLDYFDLIVPCGITARPVTSIVRELAKPVSLDKVAQAVSRHFGEVFKSEVQCRDSLDALTGPVGIPMKFPGELRRLHKEEDTFWA